MPPSPSTLDRFRGCLLGLAVGDAVGSPFEGVDGYGIYMGFGPAIDIVRDPPVERLEYTDDTEMMIGLAEVLVAAGRVDQDMLAATFACHYDPRRGYGHGAKQLLQAVRDGGDWRRMVGTLFPGGGSLGNGGAMRVAPVGLLFHRDLDRVDAEAAASAAVTHGHPVGVDEARAVALAVAMAARPDAFDRAAFFAELYARAQTPEIRDAVELAAAGGPDFSPLALGNGVEAHRSAVTAIACFDQNRDSYAQTLAAALRVGGDVDTIAAMAGAMSGARLGRAAIPPHLLDRLENDGCGRDYIDGLARELHDRWAAGG